MNCCPGDDPHHDELCERMQGGFLNVSESRFELRFASDCQVNGGAGL